VLAGYSSGGSSFTTTAGLNPATSPSVALLTDGTYEAPCTDAGSGRKIGVAAVRDAESACVPGVGGSWRWWCDPVGGGMDGLGLREGGVAADGCLGWWGASAVGAGYPLLCGERLPAGAVVAKPTSAWRPGGGTAVSSAPRLRWRRGRWS